MTRPFSEQASFTYSPAQQLLKQIPHTLRQCPVSLQRQQLQPAQLQLPLPNRALGANMASSSYNAHGLREEDKPTLSTQPFNQADMFVIIETWLTEDRPVPQIPGYFAFNLGARPSTRGRSSGGIAVYCANKFSGKVSVWRQDLQHQSRIWLKCDSSIFQCSESYNMIYYIICALYLPPCGSSLYRHADAAELYQDILAEIAEARVSGQVLLTGDFNARTAHLSDQFEDDLSDHVALPSDHEFDVSQYAAPLRQSCDAVVNDFGLLLLQFCQGARLFILNGVYRATYLRILPVMLLLEVALLIILLHQQAFAVGHILFKFKT